MPQPVPPFKDVVCQENVLPLEPSEKAIAKPKDKKWTHLLTQPVYTIHTDEHTLYIRQSTLLRIPYFAELLEDGSLEEGKPLTLTDQTGNGDAVCLILSTVEDESVPKVFSNDGKESVDLDERIETYLQAYSLAGEWNLEKIQNGMIDELIQHYLIFTISATDIGVLLELGLGDSKLCTLLMRELAGVIVNREYIARPPTNMSNPERMSTANALKKDGQNVNEDLVDHDDHLSITCASDIGFDEDESKMTCDSLSISRPDLYTTRETMTEYSERTKPLDKLSSDASSVKKNEVFHQAQVWKQIRSNWTIEGCTELMAMMVDVPQQSTRPTARSPIELAAADLCQYHTHTTTEVCAPRQARMFESQGQKRKRDEDSLNTSSDSGSDVYADDNLLDKLDSTSSDSDFEENEAERNEALHRAHKDKENKALDINFAKVKTGGRQQNGSKGQASQARSSTQKSRFSFWSILPGV